MNRFSSIKNDATPVKNEKFKGNLGNGTKSPSPSSRKGPVSMRLQMPGPEDDRIFPSLVSSFSSITSPEHVSRENSRKPVEKATVGVQVESFVPKHEFDTMTAYQKWIQGDVETFLTALRRSIVVSKPICIEDYVMHYCNRAMMGQEQAHNMPADGHNKKGLIVASGRGGGSSDSRPGTEISADTSNSGPTDE
jgi:hypothetical protein